MKKTYLSLLALVVAFAMVACDTPAPVDPDNKPGGDDTEAVEITFSAVINGGTRVDEGLFEDDDEISVYGFEDVEEPYLENECFTYADELFSGDAEWPEGSTEESLFVAFYPYNKTDVDFTEEAVKFSVKANQTKEAAYTAADQMLAYAVSAPTEDPVELSFDRLNAQVDLTIVNEVKNDEVKAVAIEGVFDYAMVLFDLEDEDELYQLVSAADYDEEAAAEAKVSLFNLDKDGGVWSAILPVQTLSDCTIVVKMYSGEEHNIKMEKKLTLKAGKNHSTELTIKSEGTDDGGNGGGGNDGGSDDGTGGGGSDDGGSDDGTGGGGNDDGTGGGGSDDGDTTTIDLEWSINDWVDGGNLDYTQES